MVDVTMTGNSDGCYYPIGNATNERFNTLDHNHNTGSVGEGFTADQSGLYW